MKLGQARIKGLLENYDGQEALAIGAYNAGEKPVNRWITLHGDPRGQLHPGIDYIDWIELIPYKETRTYIQRVLGNVGVYHRLMGH
jgi:soluble lytic murein transglycosylase